MPTDSVLSFSAAFTFIFTRYRQYAQPWVLGIILLLTSSCGGSAVSTRQEATTTTETKPAVDPLVSPELRDHQSRYADLLATKCGLLASDGSLWFGTLNKGLIHLTGERVVQYTDIDGLPVGGVMSLTEGLDGTLYVGMTSGLCRFDGETFATLDVPWDGNEDLWGPGLNAQQIISLMTDKEGVIWIGTWGAGAYSYDGAEFVSYLATEGRLQSDGLYKNAIQDIMQDSAGDIWFCSMTHGGLSRYNGVSFEHYDMTNGLATDMVPCILEDRSGEFWFGSLGNREAGLNHFDGEQFSTQNEADGLCNNNVWSLYQDRVGVIWITSYRGAMCRYDGERFEEFVSSDGQRYEGMHFVMEDAEGHIWFGGEEGGLYTYDGTKVLDRSALAGG